MTPLVVMVCVPVPRSVRATRKAPVRNGCAAENCTVDAASLHVVSGAWPAPAQQIIDAAGAGAP